MSVAAVLRPMASDLMLIGRWPSRDGLADQSGHAGGSDQDEVSDWLTVPEKCSDVKNGRRVIKFK